MSRVTNLSDLILKELKYITMDYLSYIEIHLNGAAQIDLCGQVTYENMIENLWQEGISGLTVSRRHQVLGTKGDFAIPGSPSLLQHSSHCLEICGIPEEVHRVYKYFDQHSFHDAQVVLIPSVYDAKIEMEDFRLMNNGTLLKVYVKEEDMYNDIPLYRVLVMVLKKMNIGCIHVERAVEALDKLVR